MLAFVGLSTYTYLCILGFVDGSLGGYWSSFLVTSIEILSQLFKSEIKFISVVLWLKYNLKLIYNIPIY